MLVLLPLFLARTFGDGDPVAPQLIALWMVAVGAMMVGKFQTPSFKSATFYADHGRFVVLGFVLLVAALVTYPWVTLMVFDLAYLVLVAHAALRGRAPGAGSPSDDG
jgi:CDP-diacylglycerol--serine O-phosphatidyltransferase